MQTSVPALINQGFDPAASPEDDHRHHHEDKGAGKEMEWLKHEHVGEDDARVDDEFFRKDLF